jgi:hypothetical protein
MELKYFVIILALLSISLLYLLSTFSSPAEIDLSDISNYENKQVVLSGVVSNHFITSYESQIITIRDIENSNEELTIFVEKPTNISYGDVIKAMGSIQKYDDSWELVVTHPKNVEIISSWRNNSNPLWQVAEQPLKYLDLNIQTHGCIDRIYDSYFYLTDSSGRYSLIVYFDPHNKPNITEGSLSTITGRFEYDSKNFRYCINQNYQNIVNDHLK